MSACTILPPELALLLFELTFAWPTCPLCSFLMNLRASLLDKMVVFDGKFSLEPTDEEIALLPLA